MTKMKKSSLLILLFLSFYSAGCSIPRVSSYNQIYSFTKEEVKQKGAFGLKTKVVFVKDFRGNDMYDDDIVSLKEGVEKYIASHASLNEAAKDNLRQLKVAEGLGEDEVKLLLGKPDNIIQSDKKDKASAIWVYSTNKRSAFMIIIFPVFFSHEAYYLYFKDNSLVQIEKHYFAQVIATSQPTDSKSKK